MHQSAFDPNGPATNSKNLFGLPYRVSDADLIVIPVPWEVTTSYGSGTSDAPENILQSSLQVDLHDMDIPEAWKSRIALDNFPVDIYERGQQFNQKARVIAESPDVKGDIEAINNACEEMVKWVYDRSSQLLSEGKRVCTLGGDHSTCLGLIQALGNFNESFSILQIDAHADLRKSYCGFNYSHASVMHHALNVSQVNKLVQVGIRDLCEEEANRIQANAKIITYFDSAYRERLYRGDTWGNIVKEIVSTLGPHVYVSFDVDGFNPALCPNTGTPVPGGLEFQEAIYLLKKVAESREIIGFDISETGNGSIDGNVSARLLYKLANITLHGIKNPARKGHSLYTGAGQPVKPH